VDLIHSQGIFELLDKFVLKCLPFARHTGHLPVEKRKRAAVQKNDVVGYAPLRKTAFQEEHASDGLS
jgi:hypothetical protein